MRYACRRNLGIVSDSETFESIVALQRTRCQCGNPPRHCTLPDLPDGMQRSHLPRPQSIGEKDENLMYIVAIGWLYVALMMAITEHNVVAGVATFLMYGMAPVALVLYIMGTPGRRRRKAEAERAQAARGKDE